ncbi:MAG: histidine phosphatase family protein [Bryobacteraceae bacterium]
MTTSKSIPLRLYFIRHGETGWTISGQHTGRTDIPLTAHGEDEARELVPRIRDSAFAHVLTSPLERARRTCELLGLGGVAKIEPDLAEWDYGDYEGRRSADIREGRPDWNLFRDGPPHGETPAQISNRADRVIAGLRGLDGNVALFSHGHFGRVLAARWIGLSVESAQYLLLSTASLSVLCYEHDQTDQPAIALWNSSARPFDQEPDQCAGNTRLMQERAIQRWDNEGGGIPQRAARRGEQHAAMEGMTA